MGKPVWDEDMRMFKLAGIDVATLNVFSWARNQRDVVLSGLNELPGHDLWILRV